MLEGPGYGPLRSFRTFEGALLRLKVNRLRMTGIVTLSIIQLTSTGGNKEIFQFLQQFQSWGKMKPLIIEVEAMLNYCWCSDLMNTHWESKVGQLGAYSIGAAS